MILLFFCPAVFERAEFRNEALTSETIYRLAGHDFLKTFSICLVMRPPRQCNMRRRESGIVKTEDGSTFTVIGR